MDDWTDLPGRLFVVSGPSGVGKTTLLNRLMERPDLRIRRSISATTRAPRAGEEEGVDYFFVTRDQFEQALARGELLEWAEVHGHFYGTPAGPVRALMAAGTCVILVIDVQGGLQVRDRVPGAVLIWISPPSWESLEARLRERSTDDEPTILRRLENARREQEVARRHYPLAGHVVNRDHLEEEAVAALAEYLRNHDCGG